MFFIQLWLSELHFTIKWWLRCTSYIQCVSHASPIFIIFKDAPVIVGVFKRCIYLISVMSQTSHILIMVFQLENVEPWLQVWLWNLWPQTLTFTWLFSFMNDIFCFTHLPHYQCFGANSCFDYPVWLPFEGYFVEKVLKITEGRKKTTT